MKIALIIKITSLLYGHGLRSLLISYIDDVAALDSFLGYKDTSKK